MNQEQKWRFDAIAELEKQCLDRLSNRRADEWRVAFTLWTGLVAAIASAAVGQLTHVAPIVSFVAGAFVILHAWWLRDLSDIYGIERRMAKEYESELRKLCEFSFTKELSDDLDHEDRKRRNSVFGGPLRWFAVGVTAILAFTLIMVLCASAVGDKATGLTGYCQKQQIQSATETNSEPRRRLRVVLYPYIPAKHEFFNMVEHAFECAEPQVDLEIIDLTDSYYDTENPKGLKAEKADIYEIDSIFLQDFVQGGRIQELPKDLMPAVGEYLTNAEKRVEFAGKLYGVPHWVCGNFLYHRSGDDAISSARNLGELERALKKEGPKNAAPNSGHGLFIDLKGKTTLGELYLDSEFDRHELWSLVQQHLPIEALDSETEKDLGRAMRLCEVGYCRSDEYHDKTGFYARQFARNRARALVGYSEQLFYLLSESQQSCLASERCLTDMDISVKELALADRGSHPISWVDMLTIDKECKGQCKEDASKFIRFVNSEEVLLKVLTPTPEHPSRYLLPAKRSMYGVNELIQKAPLLPRFKELIEKTEVPTGTQLAEQLQNIGKQLNARLDKQVPVKESRPGRES